MASRFPCACALAALTAPLLAKGAERRAGTLLEGVSLFLPRSARLSRGAFVPRPSL